MRFSSSPNRPSAWKEMKLADVCKTFTSGGTPSRKKPEYFENGTVPWVRTKELNDGVITEVEEFITLEALQNSSAKILPKDTVLLAMYGATVGKLGILGLESSCNQACAAMVPKDGIVDYRFLYYLLLNHRELIISQATGGAQQNLSGELIKGFTFDFPTFQEQVAISEVLWWLDEKIRLNKELSKTLEELAQTVFQSWFIDFDPVKAKIASEKPLGMSDETASLFPESMEESEVGPIPIGWTMGSLGDVLSTLESGKRPRGGAQKSGVPSIGAESIRRVGQFNFAASKYIPRDFFESMPSGKVLPYDVLIYKDGAGAGSYVSMFGEGFPFEEFAINEHVFLARSTSVPQSYLFHWLNQDTQKVLMIELAQKSAQPGLNQQDTRSIPILVPSEGVLRAFSQFAEPLIKSIMYYSLQNVTLESVRENLLPRLLSGELQIPKDILVS